MDHWYYLQTYMLNTDKLYQSQYNKKKKGRQILCLAALSCSDQYCSSTFVVVALEIFLL